jgi:hypothetical protein
VVLWIIPPIADYYRLKIFGTSDNIKYVYANAHHMNPLCLLVPPELFRQAEQYNEEMN